MPQSFRAFMLTINNPKIPVKAYLDQWLADDLIVFGAGQTEQGEQGTVHHQIYIVTKANPKNSHGYTVKWVKDNIHKTAHIEPRKGTHQQALDYVTKEETRVDAADAGPFRVGKWSDTEGQTKGGNVNASKIMTVKKMIDEGARDSELWQASFGEMLRYGKAFERYRVARKDTYRAWQTRVVAIHGPPGTGKSHIAYERARAMYGDDFYPLHLEGGDTVWFDGYSGQKCIIIEEFYGNMKVNFFLKLCDKYPLLVQTKGGMTPFLAEMIIITSNEHPFMWYGKGAEPGAPSKIPIDVLNAVKRRLSAPIGHIVELKDIVTHTPDAFTTEDLWNEMGLAAQEVKTVIDLTSDEAEEDHFEEIDYCHTCGEASVDCLCHTPTSGDDDDGDVAGIISSINHNKRKIYCDCFIGDLPCDLVKRRNAMTSSTTFELIAPPNASAAAFKKYKQIPGQSKLNIIKREPDDDVDDK